ncbi:MAG: hypothetical protein CVU79_06940 [Elusimicrobia bacterium HGW-Elusimicrobia-3]|nr:MAG: hypothetical protein CVU79_06940 [Elusimicrobia bacterium HGW-Elusimicrobia-3]
MNLTGLRDSLLCAAARAAAGACGPFVPARRRPGQTTVEYLLLLAVVAGMAAMMVVLFHKKMLGGFFTIVGSVIGAGQPK